MKNEKILNKFLCGLPESALAQCDPDDLQRLIQKEESKHAEKQELFSQFVKAVKDECVMNVHYFTFTGLPDLILRRNYTRDQYVVLQKLMISVKNAYLEQRNKAEAENNEDMKQ